MSRSAPRLACSRLSVVLDSASSQSTGSPSEIERVTSSMGLSALMTHDLSELAKRALDTHPRRIGARPVHHARDLFVVELQLDPEMEEELVVRLQSAASILVALEQVDADELVER